jgi:ribosomal protein S18 acetylase RimI-like enzyme
VPISSVDYRPEYGLEVVKLWRRAFQRAMGLPEQDRFEELSGHLDFFASLDPAGHHLLLEPESSRIVAFMSLSPGYLNHLYVHVEWQGQGLGRRLLENAKSSSGGRIDLHTFQLNTGAQAFYLSQGFREIERGFAAAEGNPWATSQTQLADIRYRWEQS